MRESWISEIKNSKIWKGKISVIFVTACSPFQKKGEICYALREEYKTYPDMLIFNLEDSYRMFSVKVLNFIKYVITKTEKHWDRFTQTLQPKPIIIKLTDDTVVFASNLIRLIQILANSPNDLRIAGQTVPKNYHTMIRDPTHRHYVPEYIYGNSKIGVSYAAGVCYLISYPAAKMIFDYAKCLTAILFQDDLMVTGLLREKLSIPLLHTDDIEHRGNIYEKNSTAVVHGYPSFNIYEQMDIWKNAEKIPL